MIADSMVSFKGVNKTYLPASGPVHALDRVDLDIASGEFITVVGRSGCGKSTLLNLVAGFERPDSGEILVSNCKINGPGPDRGVVFQEYALFPWMTVESNVAFGPESIGKGRDAREIARHFIKLVGLHGFENKYPHELSGGMRQRCALARTFANDPAVMLVDEPLAALDAMTRVSLQDELFRIWSDESRSSKKTVIYITHLHHPFTSPIRLTKQST